MGDDVVLGDPIAVSVHAPQRVLRKFVPLVSRQSIPAEGLGVILNDRYAVLVIASQVRWDENVLCLSDETTKTAIARTIPISQRLRAELDMRRTDPMGQPFPMSACVFGNEVGDPIKSVRKAWTKTANGLESRGSTSTTCVESSPRSCKRRLASHRMRSRLGSVIATSARRAGICPRRQPATCTTHSRNWRRPENVAQTPHKRGLPTRQQFPKILGRNRKSLIAREVKMVGAPGFEPRTSCSQSRRATGLRHAPTRG